MDESRANTNGYADKSIEISGTVASVIYFNENTGYTVLRLLDSDGRQMTVVGCLPFAAPGESIIVSGNWTRHTAHGDQFQARHAQRIMPRGTDAIYEYLSSGVIKGIGPATAMLFVNMFGEEALSVLQDHPEEISKIRGISHKKAEEMSSAFRRQTGLRKLIEFFDTFDLRPQLAMRMYKFYGETAMEILKENPYTIAAEHIGANFSEADSLALELGFEGDSAQRISAAIIFELIHNADNGHSFIPRDKLSAATAHLIEVDAEAVEEGIDALSESGEIVISQIAGLEACYLYRLYKAETYSAQRVLDMASVKYENNVDVEETIQEIERSTSISYAPMQRRALQLALERQIIVLTGGPGTGKTTSLRAILNLFDRMGLETVMAAPTGRAAKRMTELTGREASTIHRLLEAGYSSEGDETVFRRDESDPLECDAVILDECSMIDILLFGALLSAMPAKCRIVMVGDADQLPSVGPGNVFSDIIRSGIVETVRLTEIFRQMSESRIVSCAHMINLGNYPDLTENKGDFFFLRRADSARAVETIIELCQTRLPENMKIDPMDIQVLTPTRHYETGTETLNRRLQQAVNPPSPEKKEKRFGEIIFREGDRVMQIRNNYDIIWKKSAEGMDAGSGKQQREPPSSAGSGSSLGSTDILSGAGVYNGDIGRIINIDIANELVTVNFDERIADYSFDMLGELEHAFAMTVHKSQGSEYRAVILSACKGSPLLMHRSVLYTAVTRARELLIIVGDDEIVRRMTDNYRQTRRYSGLRARLALK